MEAFETLIQSVSYFGVFQKLMSLSSTDIAVIFLVSKPAFVMMAGLAVLTARARGREELLEHDAPAGLLGEDDSTDLR